MIRTAWARMLSSTQRLPACHMCCALSHTKRHQMLARSQRSRVPAHIAAAEMHAYGGCRYWGGGVFCAENTGGLPAAPLDCYDETGTLLPTGTCLKPQIVPKCNGNGEVLLPYGSPEYMGLGFSVFATLVVVELFGSPAMRNIQVRFPALTPRH